VSFLAAGNTVQRAVNTTTDSISHLRGANINTTTTKHSPPRVHFPIAVHANYVDDKQVCE
jgi:hypothetical protein